MKRYIPSTKTAFTGDARFERLAELLSDGVTFDYRPYREVVRGSWLPATLEVRDISRAAFEEIAELCGDQIVWSYGQAPPIFIRDPEARDFLNHYSKLLQ